MKSEQNKRENRKALKVFVPTLLISGCIGGVFGYFSQTESTLSFSERIAAALTDFLYFFSPYGVIVSFVISAVIAIILYSQSKRLFQHWEEDDEETYERIDQKLNLAMVTLNVATICSFMFFSFTMPNIESYIDDGKGVYFVAVVVFILGSVVHIKLNQMLVDFTKIMNPQLSGSVYDMKFNKKWEESCDELEKFVIYKAAYKAFTVGSTVCAIMWIVVTLCSMIFDYGPVPVAVVSVIWMTLSISYSREAYRLEKEKINE